MRLLDRNRETLEAEEFTVRGRTVAVAGWKFAPVWTDTEISDEHITLMAGVGRAIWDADKPQPHPFSGALPDPRDYPSTPRHHYRVDARCPKFVREAFDLYLDQLVAGGR